MTARGAGDRRRGERSQDAGDVLVGHRRQDERDGRRIGLVAALERRPEIVERPARAAAPAGLWAPSSRTSRTEPSAVPEVVSSSSSRPGQRAPAKPRRRASAGTEAIPAASSASSTAPATAAFAAWCRPRNPIRVSPRPLSATTIPSRSQPRTRGEATSVSGTPSRRARRWITPSASPVAPVTARSPRSMIAAFSRAIAVTVAPSRSVWSRSTLVIAATPPSQAWVASSRPPSPTSTRARSIARLGEPAEGDGGQQLELRRRSRAARDPRCGVQDLADEPRERRRIDQPTVDLEPLAVADEMRLGRLGDAVAGRPQRGPGQGEDAALAVGAGDQRAPERQLRIAELGAGAPASGPGRAGCRSGHDPGGPGAPPRR